MKDMSEEKDELFPIIDRILEGELCSVDAHVELLHWRDKSAKEQIKSLESRLKEAQEEIKKSHHSLTVTAERLSQAEAELKDTEEARKRACADAEALANRLSQAEDELRISQEAVEALLKNKDSIEARLSNLMDVAGKMAGALKPLAETRFVDFYGVVSDHWFPICEQAKLALAEWDGIKESK